MTFKREILVEILANIKQKDIILLIGARQTGKTTILKQIKNEIEKPGLAAYFLNLENLEFVALLNQSPENLFKIFPLNKKSSQTQVVFIDEIQYLENPTNFLKYLYDEYPGTIKLVVSGSSAFYLDKKFKDSLAGRKKIFHVQTLGLRDFLIFKRRDDILPFIPTKFSPDNYSLLEKLPLSLKKDLEILVDELMVFGGYPRVALAVNAGEKKAVLEELASAYIKKDILEAAVRQPEHFYKLFRILSAQTGNLINTNELSNTLGLSRSAVSNYLYIMQKSFHVALVPPYSRNLRKELTKMPKCYFFDSGLRNYFINNFNPLSLRQDPGQVLENFVFRQLVDKLKLDDIHYWRTQSGEEVDFVVDDTAALEVKFTDSSFQSYKYASFRRAYPHLSFHLISYAIQQKNMPGAWPVWLI